MVDHVLERERTQIALRERPFGLAVAPDAEVLEYANPRYEAGVVARWTPVLEGLGATVLGVRDMLAGPTRITLDGFDWDLTLMADGAVYRVPESVFHRVRAAEAAGVRFTSWVWGEERLPQPQLQPIPESVPEPVRAPVGEPPPRPAPRSTPRPVPGARRRLDPLLIGVIATGPQRGLWVCLGAWLH